MAVHSRLIYEFDEFQLDPEQRKLWRRGQVMPLHGKAFEMLLVLIRNRGRLLTQGRAVFSWSGRIKLSKNRTSPLTCRRSGERLVSAPATPVTSRQFPDAAIDLTVRCVNSPMKR